MAKRPAYEKIKIKIDLKFIKTDTGNQYRFIS